MGEVIFLPDCLLETADSLDVRPSPQLGRIEIGLRILGRRIFPRVLEGAATSLLIYLPHGAPYTIKGRLWPLPCSGKDGMWIRFDFVADTLFDSCLIAFSEQESNVAAICLQGSDRRYVIENPLLQASVAFG